MIHTIESIGARSEISEVKARYCRCIDCKDWEGFARVFASDAVIDFADAVLDMPPESRATMIDDEGMIRGRANIAAFVEGVVGDAVTVHHVHMPEIELTSPNTAHAVWAMEDVLRFPEGAPIRTLHGFGHYHETYEKIEGEWAIKTLTLSRLRVDTELAQP